MFFWLIRFQGGGRFYSVLIDSSTAEPNAPPPVNRHGSPSLARSKAQSTGKAGFPTRRLGIARLTSKPGLAGQIAANCFKRRGLIQSEWTSSIGGGYNHRAQTNLMPIRNRRCPAALGMAILWCHCMLRTLIALKTSPAGGFHFHLGEAVSIFW